MQLQSNNPSPERLSPHGPQNDGIHGGPAYVGFPLTGTPDRRPKESELLSVFFPGQSKIAKIAAVLACGVALSEGLPVLGSIAGGLYGGVSIEREYDTRATRVERLSLEPVNFRGLAAGIYSLSGRGDVSMTLKLFGTNETIPGTTTQVEGSMKVGMLLGHSNPEKSASVINSEVCTQAIVGQPYPPESICSLPASKRDRIVVKIPLQDIKTVVETIPGSDTTKVTERGSLTANGQAALTALSTIVRTACIANNPAMALSGKCNEILTQYQTAFSETDATAINSLRNSLLRDLYQTATKEEWGDFKLAILDAYKEELLRVSKGNYEELSRLDVVFVNKAGIPTNEPPDFSSSLFDELLDPETLAKKNEVLNIDTETAEVERISKPYESKDFTPETAAKSPDDGVNSKSNDEDSRS
ncbi:hypothetical protein KBD11_00405 [Candidatus Saccharibacteria bacterium]|nr:hypothetical protein [Candidatus Saccharibacteria bacterium]